jgi:membrane associated rhomboid family serine protease
MSNPLARQESHVEGLTTHATRVVAAISLMVTATVGLWALEVADYAMDGRLDRYGIRAHDVDELPQIFTAPFLHGGFEHLIGNTLPFLVLGFLAAARGLVKFLIANLLIIVVGGLGVWFTGSPNAETLGASLLIFGYFGYLLGRGLFERYWLDIVIALGVLVFYGTMFYGVVPSDPRISWQGHLFGLVGGVLAAWTLRRRIRSAE